MNKITRRPVREWTDDDERELQTKIALDPDSAEATDEELASARPAREVLPSEFFEMVERERRRRGRPSTGNAKKQVTLRLDQDVVESFKSEGAGWQSRINDALRKARGL
jgi:uncharacterized protein (DUF4415 family)